MKKIARVLHKAAKAAFDQFRAKAVQNGGRAKLPSLKELSQEYAQTLAAKKDAYADYREARKEMQDLLIARKNIETILGTDTQRTEEKKTEQSR